MQLQPKSFPGREWYGLDLFSHLDFWEWINAPFESPPAEIDGMQLSIFSSDLGEHAAYPPCQ
jgi:hypothetical protein